MTFQIAGNWICGQFQFRKSTKTAVRRALLASLITTLQSLVLNSSARKHGYV